MAKKVLGIILTLFMVVMLLNNNSDYIIASEYIYDEIPEELYDQYYYDEEEDGYEYNPRYNEELTNQEISVDNGTAILPDFSNYNGNNLTYSYKIINIPKINNSDVVIQKTYIASSYIYYIQRKGTTLYLSRCLLPTSGTVINASGAERMTLTNFGHSQTLEYDENSYFWIGCNASDEIYNRYTGSTYNWSTQIARVQFQANTTKDYTQVKRLVSVSYANKTGTSMGPIRRVEAALSTNKRYLLIWARTYSIEEDHTNDNLPNIEDRGTGYKRSNYKTRFSIYDVDEIKEALENANGLYVSCTNTAIKNACLYSYTSTPGDGVPAKIRYGSNQGLEINNSKQIYLASESRTNGTSNGKYFYKFSITDSNLSIISDVLITGSNLGAGSRTELEGLQIRSSMLNFAVKNYAENGNIHYIYELGGSVFN